MTNHDMTNHDMTNHDRHRPMLNPHTKQPTDCSNMLEIRTEIDQIDRLIVGLLGTRRGYVQAAAKFKTSESTVRALDRVASMLEERERWAAEAGLEPEPIRQLFQNLIEYFTEHELQEWSTPSSRRQPPGSDAGTAPTPSSPRTRSADRCR